MPRLPGIFTDEEYRIVRDTLTLDTASKYHLGRTVPHPKRKGRLVAILGRDPWESAPIATSRDAAPAKMPISPAPVPVAIAVYETTLNACADDDLCLAARKATMRYTANTLADQRRRIVCTSCKRGIARAKAEAAKKTAHVGALVCDCGEEKTRDARTCHACASERKRSFRPQPCRGARGARA